MSARADLHLHTTASDGTWTPEDLVLAAKAARLVAIAVTDHDTTAAVAEVQQLGERHGIEVIPGVELSLQSADEEVHLLGYGIDPHDPVLTQHMERMRSDRQLRLDRIVARLLELGLEVSKAEVAARVGEGTPGRPHVALVLVEKGYAKSVADAFDRYLAPGRPAYIDRHRLGLEDGVRLIHDAGGLAVCAHPGLLERSEHLDQLIAAGIDGIEVVHSEHSSSQTEHYTQVALEHGLALTGGSDCHGPGVKREVFMGRYTIPAAWVQTLKQRNEGRSSRR